MPDLLALEQRALAELHAANSEDALRAWHTRYFGDQGEVKLVVKEMGKLPRHCRSCGKRFHMRLEAVVATEE